MIADFGLDKNSPCGNCTSWCIDCVFPSPIRRCHRQRKLSKADPSQDDTGCDIPEKLEARLRNLELKLQTVTELIENQRRDPISIDHSDLPTHTSNAQNESLRRLDTIESRFDSIFKSLSPSSSKPEHLGFNFDYAPERPDSALSSRTFPQVFPSSSSDINSSLLQPSASQIPTIWQIFKDGPDQVVKVVHRPSAERLLQQALRNHITLDNGEIALVFAIYFASAVSMSAEQLRRCFNMSQSTAIPVFRSATEKALMRAGFLSTESLTTMQALVLFIAFSRIDQSQPTWALIGLARRLNPIVTTKVGTPFEIEMRRRIWWHLWFLDYRGVVNEGEDDSMTMVETQLPANVHDEDLYTGMTHIPEPFNGWTAMTFSLIRFTIARTALIVDRDIPRHSKKALIDECALMVQSTYLRHCDGQELIHWLAQHVAHVHITEMHIKLYSQYQKSLMRGSGSWTDRDRLIEAAVDILDVKARLRSEPDSQSWKWLLNPFPHFMPLQFLLNELSKQEIRPPPTQIWTIAENSYLMAASEIRTSKNTNVLRSLMIKVKTGTRGMLEWQQLSETSNSSSVSGKRPGTDSEITGAEDANNFAVLDFNDFNYDSLENFSSFGDMTSISEISFPIMEGLDLDVLGNERSVTSNLAAVMNI